MLRTCRSSPRTSENSTSNFADVVCLGLYVVSRPRSQTLCCQYSRRFSRRRERPADKQHAAQSERSRSRSAPR
jgi:hypothetical protein